MTQKINNKKDGFTIIEVVLVLAIAGLIFLIVFLAVPQLQRSRRDTQRRSDAARVLTELNNYASANNGNYPTTQATLVTNSDSFENRYLDGLDFNDPSTGRTYGLVYSTSTAVAGVIDVGQMQVARGRVCSGERFAAGDLRDVAVRVALDSGDTFFCTDLN